MEGYPDQVDQVTSHIAVPDTTVINREDPQHLRQREDLPRRLPVEPTLVPRTAPRPEPPIIVSKVEEVSTVKYTRTASKTQHTEKTETTTWTNTTNTTNTTLKGLTIQTIAYTRAVP